MKGFINKKDIKQSKNSQRKINIFDINVNKGEYNRYKRLNSLIVVVTIIVTRTLE